MRPSHARPILQQLLAQPVLAASGSSKHRLLNPELVQFVGRTIFSLACEQG